MKPYGAGTSKAPLKPDGPDIERRTDSKSVAERWIDTGKRATPPDGPTAAADPTDKLKSPRGPIRLTSSRCSCALSGSVDVLQLSVPR